MPEPLAGSRSRQREAGAVFSVLKVDSAKALSLPTLGQLYEEGTLP